MGSGGWETGATRGSKAFWARGREAQGCREEPCSAAATILPNTGTASLQLDGSWRWHSSWESAKTPSKPALLSAFSVPCGGRCYSLHTRTVTDFALLSLKQTPSPFAGRSLELGQREGAKVHSFSSRWAPLSQAQTGVVSPPSATPSPGCGSLPAFSLPKYGSSPPRCSALDSVPAYCISFSAEQEELHLVPLIPWHGTFFGDDLENRSWLHS